MNGFLLDTNVPSELVRPRPEPSVLTWIAAQDLDALFLSVVSFGEMRKGIEIMAPGKKRSELEGWLDRDIQLRGQPISVPDARIAATALEHGLTVVTRNSKDFTLPGITVFNPWQAP